MHLSTRTAVVTGGATGVGAACARRLAAGGARVVTWDRPGTTGDVEYDPRDPVSVDRALARTVELAGTPSIHVAAAGTARTRRPLQDMFVGDFDDVLDLTLRGAFLTMRAIAGAMRDAGLDGSLVAVTGLTGTHADPGRSADTLAAASLQHLCRVAAADLGTYGIRVNAVAAGPTHPADVADLADTLAATPLARLGSPNDVAEAVLALVRADWITGQVVTADGGLSMQTARGRERMPRRSDEQAVTR